MYDFVIVIYVYFLIEHKNTETLKPVRAVWVLNVLSKSIRQLFVCELWHSQCRFLCNNEPGRQYLLNLTWTSVYSHQRYKMSWMWKSDCADINSLLMLKRSTAKKKKEMKQEKGSKCYRITDCMRSSRCNLINVFWWVIYWILKVSQRSTLLYRRS